MSFIQDFKAFAMKGNVMDLAIGVIIGGAFGKIVSSLVSDIIMPIIGMLIGGVNFNNLKIVLKHAESDSLGKTTEVVTLNYGTFLQSGLDFLIIAFSIFLFIRLLGSLKKKEVVPPAATAPTKEELLLTEIRDLLKQKNS